MVALPVDFEPVHTMQEQAKHEYEKCYMQYKSYHHLSLLKVNKPPKIRIEITPFVIFSIDN